MDKHRVFVAFGSNVGDRVHMISSAFKALEADPDLHLLRSSGLWETKPMYVLDQGQFLNGVLELETALQPLDLLDRLQSIEKKLGRQKTIDKGPRSIDLDILLYGNEQVQHERLSIPHQLMLERGFVLHPLCQLIPDQVHPTDPSHRTYADHLRGLPESEPMSTMTPLAEDGLELRPLLPERRTQIMSILNVTPDSFSDGGLHPSDVKGLQELIRSHAAWGPVIIDVGGQSTRPKAPMVTAAEELTRILPAIAAIKSVIQSDGKRIVVSVDTFRASVAKAALEMGADMINDVGGGTLDADMFKVVANYERPMVIMHMRGDASTMGQRRHTSYPDGLISTIGAELVERVKAAEAAGVRRWRILLDPGIGFAKTAEQNLEILRRLDDLRRFPGLQGLPWLVGSSRKGFIGSITGVVEARERAWGTAATVAAAVQGGADVVRVQDVREMVDVVKMADAIWRGRVSAST